MITRKQWDVISNAVCTALSLTRSRIEERQAKGAVAEMYEGWLAEAQAAQQALTQISARMPWEVWSAKEEEGA